MNLQANLNNGNESVDRAILADLRSLTSSNPSRFLKLVSLFLDAIAADLSSMRVVLAMQDMAGLKDIAHGLKGTAANMGATRLAAICADMEKACGSDDLNRVEQQVTNLESESSNVVAILTAEIAS
jgi:HPt (histidine-containing phosphotransfer) domain-containing protein